MKTQITQIAIGNFDGVHLAHQNLFSHLGENAGVVVILNENLNLTPYKFREKFCDLPFFYFDLKDIKDLNGAEFIALLKQNFINLKKIIVGYDFKFGKNRAFDANFLRANFSGETEILSEFKIENLSVHSSLIKEFLSKGDLENTKKFLGRDYEIFGEIISGQGIGKAELVATLNIKTEKFFLPKSGVYATFTSLDGGEFFKSVTFLGKRVSTDKNFSIETHILENFSEKNFKNARVKFIKFMRENKKFENLSELKTQILSDINSAKSALKGQK